MQTYSFRLKPGQDLFDEIESFVAEKKISAGCVLSSVGSLTHATLRLANREFYTEYEGHFEIVSLNGAVSTNGSHLHVSISDGDGKTIGGWLRGRVAPPARRERAGFWFWRRCGGRFAGINSLPAEIKIWTAPRFNQRAAFPIVSGQ